MSDQRKAVVLLSGGMDSCVCAAIARERHGAGNMALLHAMYGQRTEKRERQAFGAIADFYGVRERLVGQRSQTKASKFPKMNRREPGLAKVRFP
jgi:7-cyano-7-deazaguanine synthase